MELPAYMRAEMPISGFQFGAFRIAFGLYLAATFGGLMRHVSEIRLPPMDPADPLATARAGGSLLPNPLHHPDSPALIYAFLALMCVAALVFASGWWRRPLAVLLWYGWACCFNRGSFGESPWLPYVGLVILLCILVPSGEALVPFKRMAPDYKFYFPKLLYGVGWTLLALAFAGSVLIKCTNPMWVRGEALGIILGLDEHARWGAKQLLALPPVILAGLTWASLVVQALVAPLSLLRMGRFAVWLLLWPLAIGAMLVSSSPDLGVGLALILLFFFDPQWLPGRSPETMQVAVFYDGVCGMCNTAILVMIAEDHRGLLRFAPLQGTTAAEMRQRHGVADSLDSIIYLRHMGTEREEVHQKSTAILQIARDLGGFGLVFSWGRFLPVSLRNRIYDWIARNRYRWFGAYEMIKPPPAEAVEKFLK